MSRKYGVKYEQFMTLVVGILAVIAAISISSTVFSLVLFASGAVASSLGPAMVIILLKRRTHYLALNSMMLVGLSTAILWRVLGFINILSEVCPGFIVAVLVHELLMKSVFKPKGHAIGETFRK